MKEKIITIKVNGVISYIPHLSKNTLKSKVDEYFNGEA